MTETLSAPPAVPFAHPDRLFIDGRWVPAAGGGTITVVNPATEQPFVGVAEGTEPDVDAAVAAARRAFDDGPWPRLSHAERAEYLRRIARELDARAGDVAAMWPQEMGITHAVSSMLAGTIGGVFDYYAGLADTFDFEDRVDDPPGGGRVALVVREPVGVVAAIIPWNAAINIAAFKVAPALLAGCTVVLKTSPEAPGAGCVLAEIAEKVGLPPGVLNVLTTDRGPSEHLVRHPDVDKITFTGSVAAGKRIAGIAAERIARVTLELGGKSAALVLDDYDIETAAASLAGSTCLFSGQVCSSLTRLVVSRSRHDEMVEALAAAFGALTVGDPFAATTAMGPVAHRRQLETVQRYIETGVAEGARLAAGGRRPAHLSRGHFIEPTVLAGVDNRATVAREEIFGPVLSVIPADDEEHAIRLANDTVFGLNNSVFTGDVDRAEAVARRLRSGTVGHNGFRSDMMVGFGGFKQSGIGREGGPDGLRPFLENKTVILDDLPTRLATGGDTP